MWLNLFQLAFPEKFKHHTIHSLYEGKIPLNIKINHNNNSLVTQNSEIPLKPTKKYDIEALLQELVNQNELQSAVIAAICIIKRSKMHTTHQEVIS